ncbi:MAG TPA: hypothetical protein V6C96_02170 [Vampirovibrionales bacterium]
MTLKKEEFETLQEVEQAFTHSLLTEEAVELLKETLSEIKNAKRHNHKTLNKELTNFTDRDLAEALSNKISPKMFTKDNE